MNLSSDNVSGIAPEILAAIIAANTGSVPSYGDDEITRRLDAVFGEIFEHEVAVFPVATGTAANALALAATTPPWGAVFCHDFAHIANDEANAPEFFSGGAKLVTLPGSDGRLTAATLVDAVEARRDGIHRAAASVLSLSQGTEVGTVYSPESLSELASSARTRGMLVHVDGARFANAVASLGRSPADLTWRAGVDILSFGATKNGALAAEAVVFFDPARAREVAYRRKRGGHLLSKLRFVSAQLEAYLKDGFWLRSAARANAAARQLAEGLRSIPGAVLRHPVEINEVFVEVPEAVITGLLDRGHLFYRWDDRAVRLVTGFDAEPAAIDGFLADARAAATTPFP